MKKICIHMHAPSCDPRRLAFFIYAPPNISHVPSPFVSTSHSIPKIGFDATNLLASHHPIPKPHATICCHLGPTSWTTSYRHHRLLATTLPPLAIESTTFG